MSKEKENLKLEKLKQILKDDNFDIKENEAKEDEDVLPEKPVNFYRLDKSKRFLVEGKAGSKINFALIFGAIWIVFVLILSFSLPDFITQIQGIIGMVLMLAFGGIAVGMGINIAIKNKRAKAREDEILKNCTLTDAKVTSCIITRRTVRGSDDSESTYYDVCLEYKFFDADLNRRTQKYEKTYSYNPNFFKGQYLMVAFNSHDSLILKEFSLLNFDQKRFEQTQAERSDDDFDGLSGDLVKVDLTKKITDAESSQATFIASCVLFGFALILAIVMVAVSTLFYGSFPIYVYLLVLLLMLTPSITMFIAGAILLKSELRSRKHLRQILENDPMFTFGKMFATEKTYSSKSGKEIIYCYIDSTGKECRKIAQSQALHESVHSEEQSVLVAYTRDGNSTILSEYTLIDEA